MSVVCCQVEVPSTDRSILKRNPTECGVSERDIEISRMRRLGRLGLSSHGKQDKNQIRACMNMVTLYKSCGISGPKGSLFVSNVDIRSMKIVQLQNVM